MQQLEHYARADLTPEQANLELWPDVRSDLVVEKHRKRFAMRKRAIELYVGGVSPEKIQIQTHVMPSEIGDLLDRCFATHPDGRIYGFRACIPGMRVREYTRSKDLPDPKEGTHGGYAGAFSQFLVAHPEIEKALRAIYFNRAKAAGIGQEVRISIKSAKKRFDDLCRDAGIKSNQYPLNTEDGGRESLRRFLRGLHDSHYVDAVNAQGDVDARVAVAGATDVVVDMEPLDPFSDVELDGHTLDLETEIEIWIPTPTGVEVPVIVGRLTILLLVDRASTAILGKHMVLHRNYNRTDVLLCLMSALEPWKPMELTIPGLQYLPGAGLPSGVIPECAWACYDVIHLDNHRAHTSPFTVTAMQQTLKCVVNLGKHMTPLARDLVENTFHLLEQNVHRLPGTTGSHPRDPLRTKQKDKGIKRLRINEINQVLDVLVCNHNAEPHRRGFGLTPNEFIRAAIDQGRVIIRTLSEVEAQECTLMKIRKRCMVKGNFKKGKRPYIEFKYARYRSKQLANMPSLTGKYLNVEFRRDDLRFARAYLEDGSFFETLTVERLWASTPHTLEQRVLIAKLIKKKKLDLQAHPDPIHAAVDYLRDRAPTSRNAALRYAELSGENGKPHGTPVPDIPPPPDALRSEVQNGPWRPHSRNWIKLTKR